MDNLFVSQTIQCMTDVSYKIALDHYILLYFTSNSREWGEPCRGMLIWLSLQSYPVEHVSPALECDALEHGQHGLAEVVKAGDTPLGALPVLPTLVLLLAAVQAATRVGILHHLAWNKDVEILQYLTFQRLQMVDIQTNDSSNIKIRNFIQKGSINQSFIVVSPLRLPCILGNKASFVKKLTTRGE